MPPKKAPPVKTGTKTTTKVATNPKSTVTSNGKSNAVRSGGSITSTGK